MTFSVVVVVVVVFVRFVEIGCSLFFLVLQSISRIRKCV